MAQVVVRGLARVFNDDDVQIVDPTVLRSLDGLVYDDEVFTDYLGGSPEEDALSAALNRSGILRFTHEDGNQFLIAATVYEAKRPLTESELQLLVEYTMGQWSDGIGENWASESADRCGYNIMCLTPGDPGLPPSDKMPDPYPAAEVCD